MSRSKKIMALFLSIVMVLGLLPASAFAANDTSAFSDVKTSAWYHEDVQYVSENGLMKGTGENLFSPDATTTRGMIVTILYRLEGEPSPTGVCPFQDVASGKYYEKAITWAAESGIVSGFSADTFGPDQNITREQMAAILYRYATYKKYDVSTAGDLSKFPDADKVSSYAVDAMKWANAAGLINGSNDGKLYPAGNATRAQVAAILTRFCKNIAAQCTVTFQLNYGSEGTYTTLKVAKGDTITAPKAPTRSGYTFSSWSEKTSGSAFDFKTPIEKDITLYAQWNKKSSSGGSSSTVHYYTVTFDALASDATNVPESQQVRSGEVATEPGAPSRSGYIFNGWYVDRDCTEKYNFKISVTKNTTLYAEWTVTGDADDLRDNEDTNVTKDDKYTLSASEREVIAESNTEVTFYVNSTLTTPYFELYLDDTNTGVKLYDDGDISKHSDDIPNDGCYSGTYTINIADERDVQFTAKAVVGDITVTTNTDEIFVYYELTAEEDNFMNEVSKKISSIVRETKEESPTLETNELISKIRDNVDVYLRSLVEKNLIKDVEYYASSYVYTWTYSDTNINGMQFIYSESSDNIKSEYTNSEVDESTYTNSLKIDAKYSKGNVAILNYFDRAHAWSKNYDNISDSISKAGFFVTSYYDFTCDDFKKLQKYESLIMLDSHGNTSNGTPTGIPMICTQEIQTQGKNKHYSSDIKKRRIQQVTQEDGSQVYWIYPELFNFYYKDNKLNNPIVTLGLCRGYPNNNDQLVKAIKNAGAKVVLGYDASVSVPYDYNMAQKLVERLLLGDSIDEALKVAKDKISSEDDSAYDSDDGWNKRAALNYYGNGNSTLYHYVINGNFDNIYNIMFSPSGSSINGWKQYGDARVVYRLSGIKPQSVPRMAIISSGFGSMNDETTSCIYQTILVPEDVTTIDFKYDVVSEEPMEYVGTHYNDIFVADILDTNGEVLETLAYESVNTSTWYAVDGINFPGGDDTTYHTRWQSVSSNAIQKYRGKLIVIRFIVQDAGDEAFDTAALIDSVSMH